MFNEKTTKAIKAIEEEAQAIEEAYELLSELEMKDKKTSYEYEYAVKTIKSCADIEDEYLKEILTKDYAEDVFNFFSKKYNLSMAFYLHPLANNNKLYQIRIMNKIYTYLYKLMPNENFHGYSFSRTLYELSINLDLIRLTLSLLKDKKEAIKIKYNLALTIGEVEKELLETNFEVSENPYLTRNILTYNNTLKNVGKFFTNSITINILRSYIISIFSFKKDFKNNKDEYLDFLFTCTSIRACLVMLDENTANLVISKIKEFINGEGNFNLPNYPNFNKEDLLILLMDLADTLENESDVRYTIEILKSLLENLEQDKRVPNHVSLSL